MTGQSKYDSMDDSWKNGRGFSEKRNFLRMKLDSNIYFTTLNSQEKHNGRCKNLSGTGVLMETDKKLKVGSSVSITLPSERSELPNLEAKAQVVRVSQMLETHTFEIGLIFQHMY